MWVIKFEGMSQCWIREGTSLGWPFDVTFQWKLAKRFACEEDARHEILRLGLSGEWTVQPTGAIR